MQKVSGFGNVHHCPSNTSFQPYHRYSTSLVRGGSQGGQEGSQCGQVFFLYMYVFVFISRSARPRQYVLFPGIAPVPGVTIGHKCDIFFDMIDIPTWHSDV